VHRLIEEGGYTLEDMVDIACWAHTTNVNHLGFTLQKFEIQRGRINSLLKIV